MHRVVLRLTGVAVAVIATLLLIGWLLLRGSISLYDKARYAAVR